MGDTSNDARGKVFIVVVTWRTRGATCRLVRYLTEMWPHVTVVVVDCGAEHVLSEMPPGVVLMRTANLGYAGGNDLGFQYSLAQGAEFIMVVNSDAYPVRSSLSRLLEVMEGTPHAGACGAALVQWNERTGRPVELRTDVDWRSGCSRVGPPQGSPHAVAFPPGAAVLYRASALEDVGGFDSKLFLYCEEIDWAERARKRGYCVMVVPEAIALHRGSQSTGRAPKATSYYLARNRAVIRRRYARLHGSTLTLAGETRRTLRIVGGHMAKGRLSLIWPHVRGVVAGLQAGLDVSDDPREAVGEQRWETRDKGTRRLGSRLW